MANYSTTFTSAGVASGLPSGWTSRWASGATWSTIDAGSGDIALRRTHTSSINSAASFDEVNSDANRDNVEVLVKVRTSSVTAGTTMCGVFARASGSSGSETGYLGTIRGDEIRISKYVSGTFTALVATTTLTLLANTWYWLRFRCNGSGANAQLLRVWKDGDSEPGTWDLNSADSSITAAGWAGVYALTLTNTYDWSEVGIGTNGDTATIDASGGAQTVGIGQASEANAAQALAAQQARSIGQASETDAAQPIAAQQLRTVGQASESNAAQAFASAQRKAISQAAETDTAQAIAYLAPGTIGQALETDTAQPIAAKQSRTIGQASETDSAQPIGVSSGTVVAIGLALEIDTAGAFASQQIKYLGQASESALALPIGQGAGGGAGATAAEIVAALMAEEVEPGVSYRQALRIVLAALSGRTTGIGTGTEVYLSTDGATARITADFDAQGNRVSVTLNGG